MNIIVLVENKLWLFVNSKESPCRGVGPSWGGSEHEQDAAAEASDDH